MKRLVFCGLVAVMSVIPTVPALAGTDATAHQVATDPVIVQSHGTLCTRFPQLPWC